MWLTCERLRELVLEHCGFDPGQIEPWLRLDALQLTGFHRLGLITALEDTYGIEYPADLLTALETVDDLLYYTDTKIGQRLGAEGTKP